MNVAAQEMAKRIRAELEEHCTGCRPTGGFDAEECADCSVANLLTDPDESYESAYDKGYDAGEEMMMERKTHKKKESDNDGR